MCLERIDLLVTSNNIITDTKGFQKWIWLETIVTKVIFQFYFYFEMVSSFELCDVIHKLDSIEGVPSQLRANKR